MGAQCGFLITQLNIDTMYSGNRLMSTPRDREKVLTLSEVDLIRIQRHIVKYSQLFNSIVWQRGIVSHAVIIS